MTRDEFVSSVRSAEATSAVQRPDPRRLLIATTDVSTSLAASLSAVVVSGHEACDAAVWTACECDRSLPWVIANEFDKHSRPAAWDLADYKTIQPLSSTEPDTPLMLYQPRDALSFLHLVRHQGDPYAPTIIIIPGSIALEQIPRLIAWIEQLSTESDLLGVTAIAPLLDWYYLLGRGDSDGPYSLFVSARHKLVAGVLRQMESVGVKLRAFY